MTDNPFLEIDQKIAGDIYTSSTAMDELLVLCDQFGARFAGSSEEQQAAEYMKGRLEAYGLQNVHLEAVEYEGWQRRRATLQITSPLQKEIPCISLPHSPAGTVEATLVDLGSGAPQVFAERAGEIEGKIVLTTSAVYPDGSRRWIHRNEKFGRALLAGASGFIFVNHYPGYGPATGGVGPDNPRAGAALIPGLGLSLENGAYLQRLIRRYGEVWVRISSDDHIMPATSWNLLGDLPGHEEPGVVVMLGSHYDGHDISQGAADPASGTVAVLEAARALARYAKALPYTIRFALWGAEEIGLIGSTQYVDRHRQELDGLRFYLNMDMAGALDPKDIVLNEWPELASLMRTWREQMALDFGVGQSLSAHSDHFPFMLAGVPTGSIGSLEPVRGGRGYGHTQHDTVDKVTLRGMREAADLAARLAVRMASERAWPARRRSPEAVQAVLDSPDYREELELAGRVAAVYQQRVASPVYREGKRDTGT